MVTTDLLDINIVLKVRVYSRAKSSLEGQSQGAIDKLES